MTTADMRDALLRELDRHERHWAADEIDAIIVAAHMETDSTLRAENERLRAALTAFGHHADSCEFALTVCTCGFADALRSLFAAPAPVAPVEVERVVAADVQAAFRAAEHGYIDDGKDTDPVAYFEELAASINRRLDHRRKEDEVFVIIEGEMT